jgi:thiamine pyrophosphokinase
MNDKRVVIFANGLLPDLAAAKRLIGPGEPLLAADAGASHILKMGLLPSLVVGDLDSLPAEDLKKLKSAGVRMVSYPRSKDLTDLELAINFALEDGFHKLLIVAAFGGRLDMTLSNLSLLTRPDLLELEVSMDDGVEAAFFIQREAYISGSAGDIVSLIPWEGPVEVESTTGLRWPLADVLVHSYETRTISNEMLDNHAAIRIKSGLLLCIHGKLNARD